MRCVGAGGDLRLMADGPKDRIVVILAVLHVLEGIIAQVGVGNRGFIRGVALDPDCDGGGLVVGPDQGDIRGALGAAEADQAVGAHKGHGEVGCGGFLIVKTGGGVGGDGLNESDAAGIDAVLHVLERILHHGALGQIQPGGRGLIVEGQGVCFPREFSCGAKQGNLIRISRLDLIFAGGDVVGIQHVLEVIRELDQRDLVLALVGQI